MKLIRFGLAKFKKPIDEKFKTLTTKVHSVEIQTISIALDGSEEKNQKFVLLIAYIGFEGLPEVIDNLIEVPEYSRKLVEEAIEAIASFISVTERSEKKIFSPNPYLAIFPESEEEAAFLKGKKGIVVKTDGRVITNLKLPFAPELLNYLLDRLDGLELLGECINQKTALGKFRQLTQFFERAFKRSTTQYPKKLSQFLSQSPYGYTREEVEYWSSLRHSAIHGDGKKTSKLVFERDVSSIIRRMEQAAYEVLFNKLKWHDDSQERRQIYQPLGAACNKEESEAITFAGVTLPLQHYYLDGFGSYEIYQGVSLNQQAINKYFQNLWFPPNLLEAKVENKLKLHIGVKQSINLT